ncbi:hypothetical protein DESC_320055 [Desulfosarcina cetonica]|nr:hypothetical protein DESC_320055 [Desulfosarcina cetonica]
MNTLGEASGLVEIGRGGFAPDHVGVRRIGQATGNGGLHAVFDIVEPFAGARLIQDEGPVAFVDVAGEQFGAIGVGTGHQDGGHTADIGGHAGRDQLGDRLLGGHEDLAAHVAAFLGRGELIFEMHAGRAGLDHLLHQFEGVERPAEPGLGIGNDGRKPVRAAFAAVEHLDLIGAPQGVIDALNHGGDAVGRVEALVRVHFSGQVGVGRHLPATQVDGLEAGLHLLHGLVAGQRAQGVDVILMIDQVPQPLGADLGEGVFDLQVAPELEYLLGRIGAYDAPPAGVRGPVGFQLLTLVGKYLMTGESVTDLLRFFFDGFHFSSPDRG